MDLVLRIFILAGSIALGIIILRYTDKVVNLFGRNTEAEKFAWMWGGTYLLWKIIGVIVIVLGIYFAVNGWH